MKVCCIIPALNEEGAIGNVVSSIDRSLVNQIIVADNGSTDATKEVAARAGALVVHEPRKGYGWACLAGVAAAPDADVYLFLDGDGADDTSLVNDVIAPIICNEADMVIGSRVRGVLYEKGALTPPQRFGNWLSTHLLNVLYGTHYTDLGPFRAIKRDALIRMHMATRSYGWTVEMQIKAAVMGIRIAEVPVNCRCRRAGKSKVSGSVKGVILAGFFILYNIGEAYMMKLLGRLK